jgi:hypothetical protein
MRNPFFAFLSLVFIITGCSNLKSDPAKSAPKFDIQIQRFDSAFFTMDTLNTKQSIKGLINKYPSFGLDFLSKILMLKSPNDTTMVKAFYRIYMPLFKEVQNVNAIAIAKPELEAAYKRIHYYFPKYNLTHKVILYVGPLESFGNIVTNNAVAVGLQMHMGENSKWYYDEHIQTIYPPYLSRRFTPNYIAISTVQNILNDIYVKPSNAQNLIAQMVEAGKLQYIINAFLPETPDSVRFGYTNAQYTNLKKAESSIWEYLLHEKILYSIEFSDIDNFMQEGYQSSIFSESVPSNVGKYIGYKIVTAWMQQKKQKGITMQDLLNTPADKIFETAGYAP